MSWTQQDLDVYKQQLNNIQYENVGCVHIGGVYEETNLNVPTDLTFYVYRIYDRNFRPEALGVDPNGLLTEAYIFGTMGLVAVPAKDKETGSYHGLQKDVTTQIVPHPAAVWMDLCYKGPSYTIGRQVMYETLGDVYRSYWTLDERKQCVIAFTYEHMQQKILPVLRERFRLQIMAADMRHTPQFAE